MVNLNGKLQSTQEGKVSVNNRGLQYGDAVFETLKVVSNRINFWEDHYFRLMASMRMLRMRIPMNFTLEFLEEEILKIVSIKSENNLRVRLCITRKDGGFYTPTTNEIDYLIDSSEIKFITKDKYTLDLFKDFYVYSGYLSTIKTNNKLINTLASIFAKENELDNCILLNERKGIVEATNASLFLIQGTLIKTPLLSEGCLKGIAREKVINIIKSSSDYDIEEAVISPFEIQKADELFITNSIIGIQPVTNYRKKVFSTDISKKLAVSFSVLELTSK